MLEKRNILIIGATGGIGEAIARTLAVENNHLTLVGRNTEALLLRKSEYEALGADCSVHTVDLESKSSLEELCSNLTKTLQKIDWVIHAAGYINENELEHRTSFAHIEKTFLVNTLAPIYITENVLPLLTPQGGIIMISSTASLSGNPQFPMYASSKSALNTYTQALGKRLENTEQTALVICPGGTNTSMRERVAHDADTQQPPKVIADCIEEIIEHRSSYGNKDILIIRDSKITIQE